MISEKAKELINQLLTYCFIESKKIDSLLSDIINYDNANIKLLSNHIQKLEEQNKEMLECLVKVKTSLNQLEEVLK